MEFDQQLANDFLFLLDLCKSPDQVFPLDSKELQLAQLWLDHLTLYECENLDERRMVNMYMSHLCAALGEAKLYGPFLREPRKGKLEKVDFYTVTPSPSTSIQPIGWPESRDNPGPMSSTMAGDYSQLDDSGVEGNQTSYALNNEHRSTNSKAFESHGQITVGSTNLFFKVSTGGNVPPTLCPCPPKPCQCGKSGSICNCHRASAGADPNPAKLRQDEESICSYLMQDLNLTPDFLMNFDATLTSFLDVCKAASLEGKEHGDNSSPFGSRTQRGHTFLSKSQEPLVEHFRDAIQPPSLPPPDYKEMREDICELMEAISAELRGDVEPGNSDYLELELARYKGFVMSHSDLAAHLKTLPSGMKLRHFLLLGLQNDLVKLLSDFMSPDGNF